MFQTKNSSCLPAICQSCVREPLEAFHLMKMTRLRLLFSALLGLSACVSQGGVAAPSALPSREPQYLQYDINVPTMTLTQELEREFPGGVYLSPIRAQLTWDFSADYHGSPNVYFGPVAPPPHIYLSGASVVVAPAQVASKETFAAYEWPDVLGTSSETWKWWGHFVHTAANHAP